ncbi:MAG: alpha/beta hydrolase [Rhizobiaceae bacterium]
MSEQIQKRPFDGVIFLPGLMCDAQLFAPQLAALEGLYPTYVPDLGPYDSFEAMSAAVLEQSPFDRFALAGLSMGGALAMNMARWEPQRVERMAILDANPRADDDARKQNRRRQLAEARQNGVGELTRNELSKFYLAPANQTPEFIDIAVQMAEGHGVDVYERQLNALMTRQDSTNYLSDYHGPSLVLCGEQDVLCLPEWHVEMAGLLANATLSVIPGAGHLATIEAPDEVNVALLEWLQR